MKSIIFDGKKFAKTKERELSEKVSKLKTKPQLVSILVGNDRASVLYTKLKSQAATRIGIKFIIKKFPEDIKAQDIIQEIKKYNNDKKINGIMVQLPLPPSLKSKTNTILKTILLKKDVDGQRDKSPFVGATVRAIIQILNVATTNMAYFGKKAAVVGAAGTVGKSISAELKKRGYKVIECDKNTRDLYAKLHEVDLIISATGAENLIKGQMLKEGCIAIDVGAPVGDFEFKSVEDVANFVTPVPGGVGPVTIISLLENLVEAV